MSRMLTHNRKTAQIFAAVLIIVLAFGLMAPTMVNADASNPSLTITKQDEKTKANLPGAEFTLYKIMDLKVKSGSTYQLEYEALYPALRTYTPSTLGDLKASEIEALTGTLLGQVTGGIKMDPTDANGIAKEEGLELGYYMVVETGAPEGYVAGKPFFIAIPSTNNYNDDSEAGTGLTYDVSVTPKNATVPLEKKIIEGTKRVDQSTAGLNERIPFVVTTTVPEFDALYTAPVFKLTDVMSKGIDYDSDKGVYSVITVDNNGAKTGDVAATNYEVITSGNGFELSFKASWTLANKGKNIEVFYDGILNDEAVVTGPNPNTIYLDYSNNPQKMSDTGRLEDKVEVYTFELAIEKFAGDAGLAGAEFAISKTAGGDPIATVSSIDGIIKFPTTLKAGTYYITETKSPEGYKLLTNPIKVVITAVGNGALGTMDGSYTLKIDDNPVIEIVGGQEFNSRIDIVDGNSAGIIAVENHKGFTLPATGGMGIMIFLAIGLVGIATVSIVMMRNKKKAGTQA